MCLRQTSDGGYILGGYSSSTNTGSKTTTNYGFQDIWLIKTDATGNKIWERNYGGTNSDYGYCLRQTSDGGYVVGAISDSGASGNKTSPKWGSLDCWVIKLDTNGNKIWEQSFGGTSIESLADIEEMPGGGYILAAASLSGVSGNKTSPSYGLGDAWVIMLDQNGNKTFEQTFGGTSSDGIRSVRPTSDGGYLLAGGSASPVSGNKTSPNYGGNDGWLIQLDSGGNKLWEMTFGGSSSDVLVDARPTPDGGYVLVGYSSSPISGTKTSTNYGGSDYWLIKLDSLRNKIWENTFGGSADDELHRMQLTSDGGYLLGGYSLSGISGNKTNANYGPGDYWLVKVDSAGNKIWEKSFGGTLDDNLYDFQPASDGGYVLGGASVSGLTGNKTSVNYGSSDYWVVKIGFPVPSLAIRSVAGNAVLSWSSPSTGFGLEQNTNLATSNWTGVASFPADDGTNKTVTVPATSQHNFFRLHSP
jgi:hypothetical protein